MIKSQQKNANEELPQLKTENNPLVSMYFKDFFDKNSKTLIMGILNITPDSFYDGDKYINTDLTEKFKQLNMCDIIDIGAESSKPRSLPINEIDERRRINQVFKYINNSNQYYSIDTYKPKIAEYCLKNGFNMINDIKGGDNEDMLKLSSSYNVPIILMHMQGNPTTMQDNPKYIDIIDNLKYFFEKRVSLALKNGVNLKNIIIDPGIGFGKTVAQNDKIIKNISKFKNIGVPILIGLSRKSFLTYNSNMPIDRLESSIAVAAIAINNGADIIRVHDIEKSIEVFSIIDRMIKN
jgi:dihydropteroate synthase